MILSEYFATLRDRLEYIEQLFPELNSYQRMDSYDEVLTMRKISDQIVEDWLQFEEKLAYVQRLFEKGQMEMAEEEGVDELPEENELVLPRHLAFQFLQGKGYFELSMYDEAVKSFSHIIRQEPDMELARLYLAFGFLMSRRWEVSYRQFQLLAETTSYPIFASVAYNGMGVISVLEGRPDQGLEWFEKAIQSYPELSEAYFNRILAYFSLKQYEEAAEEAKKLLKKNEDDMELNMLYFHSCIHATQRDEALQALNKWEELATAAVDLLPIAAGYEKIGLYKEAHNLYLQVLPEMRSDARVWHGLGWTLWQLEQSEKALPYLLRAHTLDPDQVDFACSYAWALLGLHQVEKAKKAFEHISSRYRHPLSHSGLSHISLLKGDGQQAEQFASELLGHKDKKIQGLGHYHMGRAMLNRKEYDQALHHFNLSRDLADMKEGHLYSGLVHFIQDENEKAFEKWKSLL